jgi:hypothetical protein
MTLRTHSRGPEHRIIPRLPVVTAIACWLLLAGCARIPSGVNTSSGPVLTVSVTVVGPINPNDYYFVLFNPLATLTPNPADAGPEPVLGPPWGYNGFATGTFSSFVVYTQNPPFIVSPTGYALYSVLPNTAVPESEYVPAQTLTQTITTGTTLYFQIPLSYLATTAVPLHDIRAVQFNIVTTNAVYNVSNPNDNGTKLYDAIGGGVQGFVNSPITIPATPGLPYTSSTPQIPLGNVMLVGSGYGNGVIDDNDPNAPALDITGWTIQVTGS